MLAVELTFFIFWEFTINIAMVLGVSLLWTAFAVFSGTSAAYSLRWFRTSGIH